MLKVVALYCFTHHLLTAPGHRCDPQARASDAEVVPTAFVSALYFPGHRENARLFMQ